MQAVLSQGQEKRDVWHDRPPPNGWLPGQTAQSPLKNRVGLTGTRAHSNCPGNESRSSPSPLSTHRILAQVLKALHKAQHLPCMRSGQLAVKPQPAAHS